MGTKPNAEPIHALSSMSQPMAQAIPAQIAPGVAIITKIIASPIKISIVAILSGVGGVSTRATCMRL